jgi:guanylate kinase
VPHLAEQDDRRPVAASAHRARLDAAAIARVFVITGPSGVGKGTLIRTLRERVPELELSVSATTRRPRPGETQGVDYHFLSDDEFARRVAEGDFLEHAEYSGRRYGTLRCELERSVAAGHPVLLEIEVQGARQVRERMPDAVQIFIEPPSEDALRARLVGRGDTPPDQMQARLATAREELDAKGEFAHRVVNDRLEDALDELERIVRSYTDASPRPPKDVP